VQSNHYTREIHMNRKSVFALFSVVAALLAGPVHAQSIIGGGKGTTSFPITITQSGSYKLASNLSVPPGTDGIVIASGLNVTLDLGGFEISGPHTCTKTACNTNTYTSGIRVGVSSVRIFRGSVRGFGGAGIGRTMGINHMTLEDLVLSGNRLGVQSIWVNASRVEVRDNAWHGIDASRAVIVDSVASNNGGTGFKIDGGVLRSSIASENGQYGFDLGFGTYDMLMSQFNVMGNKLSGTAGINGLY
jgi:hypothetical protein